MGVVLQNGRVSTSMLETLVGVCTSQEFMIERSRFVAMNVDPRQTRVVASQGEGLWRQHVLTNGVHSCVT